MIAEVVTTEMVTTKEMTIGVVVVEVEIAMVVVDGEMMTIMMGIVAVTEIDAVDPTAQVMAEVVVAMETMMVMIMRMTRRDRLALTMLSCIEGEREEDEEMVICLML